MTKVTLALLGAAALALGGCETMNLPFGGEPTYAEQLENLEEQFRDARSDLKKGREMVREGNDDLKKQQNRRSRELELAQVTEIDAEKLRLTIANASTGNAAASEIESMSDRLQRLTKKAKNHREEAEDAADDIRDAERKIERGEDLVRRSERRMADAERRYRDETGKDIAAAIAG